MLKGQSYSRHREELKKEYEVKEKLENTGKPQLSRYTEKIYINKLQNGVSSLSIGERTKLQLEKKKAKDEALKKDIEAREAQEVQILYLKFFSLTFFPSF